jgi:hypothetical protein
MGHINFWLMLMLRVYCELTLSSKDTITEALTNASREVRLGVNVETPRHVGVYCCLITRT